MAGVEVPETARIILLPAKGAGTEDVLAKEKLCPVVAILPYKTFEEAVAKAKANLLVEGAGHSAAAALEQRSQHPLLPGLELPISRLVVNQASALTAGGSLTNGFAPTTTLGCGSWGGNSISENLDYKHLMNVSRIGKVITRQEGSDRRRNLGLEEETPRSTKGIKAKPPLCNKAASFSFLSQVFWKKATNRRGCPS